MPITSKQAAFTQIENTREGIPFEAIEYLYHHGKDEEIEAKIAFSLANAYSEAIYNDEESDYFSNAPLWYGVVAENHIGAYLIEPVINLYKGDSDWDFLNEQGLYLVGRLCEELGEEAVEQFMQVIESQDPLFDTTIQFLYDCFHFADEAVIGPRILKLLENPHCQGIDSLAGSMGIVQFTSTLDRLKDLWVYYETLGDQEDFQIKHTLIEIKEAIKDLEAGSPSYPETAAPYFKTRGDWKKHYKGMAHYFNSSPPPPPLSAPKVKQKRSAVMPHVRVGRGRNTRSAA